MRRALTALWRVTGVATDAAHEHVACGVTAGALGRELGDGDVTVTACLRLHPHVAGTAIVVIVGTLGGIVAVRICDVYKRGK